MKKNQQRRIEGTADELPTTNDTDEHEPGSDGEHWKTVAAAVAVVRQRRDAQTRHGRHQFDETPRRTDHMEPREIRPEYGELSSGCLEAPHDRIVVCFHTSREFWLCKFARHEQETRLGEGPLQVLDGG